MNTDYDLEFFTSLTFYAQICCSRHLKNAEELWIRVRFSFSRFLFFTQKQIPQIIVGMDRIVYHIEALPVVIRTTFEKF